MFVSCSCMRLGETHDKLLHCKILLRLATADLNNRLRRIAEELTDFTLSDIGCLSSYDAF